MTSNPIQGEPLLAQMAIESCLQACADDEAEPERYQKWYAAVLYAVKNKQVQITEGSQWHKFDKDDPDSWPENGRYWVALRNGDVSQDLFQAERISQYRIWNAFDPRYVTHWMPIEVPEPPEVIK
jgi:hypothetical protein